jgi:hypothetical protein
MTILSWSCRVLAIFALALTGGTALAQSAFVVSAPASVKPGETFHIDVSFRNDGSTGSVRGFLYLDSPLLLGAPGTSFPAPTDVLCRVGARGQVEIEMFPPHLASERPVCRIPVAVSSNAIARRYLLWVSGSCAAGENAAAFSCSSNRIALFLDGYAPWYQRNLVIVPKPVPSGPDRSTLIAFDYASTSPAPLQMLDALRPRNVSNTFADQPREDAYLKRLEVPNAAAQGLMRSVRATYRSVDEKLRAAEAAASDPEVEGVVKSGAGYGIRTYPERPRAWEPFALWLTTPVCTDYGWTGYGDRTVTVNGNVLLVEVPPRQFPGVDFVCPGGEFHFIWNMPGLPEGSYPLQLGIMDQAPSSYGWPTIPLAVQGTLPPSRPTQVPAASVALLWLLAIAMAMAGWRQQSSRSRSIQRHG